MFSRLLKSFESKIVSPIQEAFECKNPGLTQVDSNHRQYDDSCPKCCSNSALTYITIKDGIQAPSWAEYVCTRCGYEYTSYEYCL